MKTADDVIQELPWKWSVQGIIFVIGGLGYMFDAWDVTLPAYAIPLLAKTSWHLSPAALGLFSSTAVWGMAVGAFFWGTTADLVGRRRAFTYTLLIYSLCSLATAAAPTYALVLTFRFLAGFGLGGCIPVDYAMVAEFMPKRVRGRTLTLMDLWWPIGATLNGVVATALLPYHNWRLLLLVMVLPALLVFWVRTRVPESPLYLIRQGREKEARQSVDRLVAQTRAPSQTWQLPPPTPNPVKGWRHFFGQFRDVWTWNWRVTLAVWGVFITNLTLYFGVFTWLPSVLQAHGYGLYGAYLFSISATALGILGVLLSSVLVERLGRKVTIAGLGMLAAVAMVVFTRVIGVPAAARWWLWLYGFTNEIAIPAIYCYAPEVYPTLLRGTGFGWASTASRVVAGFIPVIFGAWLWPQLGLTNTFILILGLIVVASLWLLRVGPETRGVPLDAIAARAGAVAPGGSQAH